MRKKGKRHPNKYGVMLMWSFLFIGSIMLWNKVSDGGTIDGLDHQLLVLFEEDINSKDLTNFVDSLGVTIHIKSHLGNYALLHIEEKRNMDYVLQEIKQHAIVQAAAPDQQISIMRSNDTFWDAQWALQNEGRYLQYDQIGSQEMWSRVGVDLDVVPAWDALNKETEEVREVVVAIVDTGVDYDHPDLAPNMWLNPGEIPDDGIDNDGNGYVDDVYGWDFYNDDNSVCHYQVEEGSERHIAYSADNDDHGTHIAGIIGAESNNNIGVAGIASNVNVKIMVLKVNGGTEGTGSVSSAIEAIKYATMMGADICNLSWGMDEYNEALEIVMKEADMLFVAAAGNGGSNNNEKPVYPANFTLDNLISVTFIDALGALTNLSNYGSDTIDIAAPGEDIFSTVVGAYASMSGSSMAAPYVTGVAAMLYSMEENVYPKNVKDILINNIKPLEQLKGQIMNPGIPSAYQGVHSAKEHLLQDKNPPKIFFGSLDYQKKELILPLRVTDDASGIRVVKWIQGERDLAAFQRGITGTKVEGKEVVLSKPGTYSFYLSDYAGNETIKIYEALDDLAAPHIIPTYRVADDYNSSTITVRVLDDQSGVKRVKYTIGEKKVEEFLPAGAGEELLLENGRATFDVKEEGTYSLYAIDHRGNQTVQTIEVKIVKADAVKFIREQKVMALGEEYAMRAFVAPVNTTDHITYRSSDDEIATITQKGRITGRKKGKAIITARTSSGRTATCEVIIE